MIAANGVAKKLRRPGTPEIKQFSWPPHVIDRSTNQNPHNQQPHIAKINSGQKIV
jgi:hypothetical protein